MRTAETTITKSCMYWISKGPMLMFVKNLPPSRLKVSYCLGVAPKQMTAICCKQNETPRALISGAIRGARFTRRGR